MKSRLWVSGMVLGCLICALSDISAAFVSDQSSTQAPAAATSSATIPGPLHSFLRMAAVSQKVAPDEVLSLLARNVYMRGYSGWGEGVQPTEYLTLLRRYVEQARELRALAGKDGVIRVNGCSDAKILLVILGYQPPAACNRDTQIVSADRDRAFLTLDSAFPLARLEEALRNGTPFSYPYPSAQVPMLFTPADWTAPRRGGNVATSDDFLDAILHEAVLARTYYAFSTLDAATSAALRTSPGIHRLATLAPVLDFYGREIMIRSGRVVVPGGAAAESAWKDLVGAPPTAPADFVVNLLSKDKGWLAAYYDALAHTGDPQQAYFTEPHRLRTFYQALRGKDAAPSPARPAFRSDSSVFLLVSRLALRPDGHPDIPGNLDVWKEVLRHNTNIPGVRDWARRSGGWNDPDQLIESMFSMARGNSETSPLQIYLTLSEIDRRRSDAQRLSPETARLLALQFSRFGHQYDRFSEFPELNNASLARFIVVAQSLDHLKPALRGNAIGMFQANVGLWEILARQGQIPAARLNDSWMHTMNHFAGLQSSAQLFDAGRAALTDLVHATGRSGFSQEEIVDLLAGPEQSTPEGQRMRDELAQRIRSVLQDQRLVALDTLFALGDGMNEMAQGKDVSASILPLARELREFELPRPLFTNSERSEWAPDISDSRHAALQTRADLAKIISSKRSPNDIANARGQLADFLRDTLVGLNYAYYAPPGAQMLHHNPLFVRSHDFTGAGNMTGAQSWQPPSLFGSGLTAGRGAHLVGSLAGLPYALAQAEQDFIVPENVQALIWEEMVPALMSSATLTRWWTVSRNELHAVTLYQRAGEELLASAARDAKLRQTVMQILAERMLPNRAERVEETLAAGSSDDLLMPGESLYLAAEFRRRFPDQSDYWGPAGRELEALAHSDPSDVSYDRLSRDFGVPHPALAQSYARELLNVKPFPPLMGYGSRLLAESWDSSNLYWARLADELGYAPVMLNRIVPNLTRRMVEKIFATDIDDLPALVRAMHEAGDEFRRTRPDTGAAATIAAQP